MMRCWTTGMLRSVRARGSGLRWSSSAKGTTAAGKSASAETLETVAKPGVLRMRKAGARKDVEVDTTVARIIGSDWGDRSNQSVSLPMRLYWIVFAVVLGNGVYTYFSGHDESYLVEKIQKKVDEKLGVVETNEFVVMADKPGSGEGSKDSEPSSPAPVETAKSAPVTAVAAAPTPSTSAPPAKPVSMLKSKPAPSTMPFMSPMARQTARAPQSKPELQARLQELRQKQAQLEKSLEVATAAHVVEHFEHEIRMVEEQKAQTKRMLRKLK